MTHDIQIVCAPSILGLKPSGVELLGEALLGNNLLERLHINTKPIHVPTLNELYSTQRDSDTNCINANPVLTFSTDLGKVVLEVLQRKCFPIVLGGDCAILIGIMSALKKKGNHGLVFMDAHADFYEPEQSPTGELADMDLAIVTGRGPELLTNIHQLKPYVKIENVVHIGQRDQHETEKYHAMDIRDTPMYCIDAETIHQSDRGKIAADIIRHTGNLPHVDGFWLHFDTDVLSDSVNPAVDYRLPGGLSVDEVHWLLGVVLSTQRVIGMSVTIYNPKLDSDGQAGRRITDILVAAFDTVGKG